MAKGTLTSQEIRALIESKNISSSILIPEDNIQPASLDLRIARGTIVRLPGMFLPSGNDVLEEALQLSKNSNLYSNEITDDGFMLEVGIPYLLPIEESVHLPEDIRARANNKSSSGRLNLQIRLLCNNHKEFDYIPKGYNGKLYIVAIAKSFPIKIMPGETFNQIRFYSDSVRKAQLTQQELHDLHDEIGLVYSENGDKTPWSKIHKVDNSILLTADLDHDIVAYRFKGVATDALSFKDRNVEPSRFFEPVSIPAHEEHIVLSKGGFYIVSTFERFVVPTKCCSEMVAYSTGIGEYRSHFAGFFDPGWGTLQENLGTSAVLEIIPHEDILLKHGQPVCSMELFKMSEIPDKIYGKSGNHYQNQNGLKLGKQFKQTLL